MNAKKFLFRPKFLIPLVAFIAVAIFFAIGLRLDSTRVPSPLIGNQAPSFELPILESESKTLNSRHMIGGFWVLNVWASWCVACREEHHVLMEMAAKGVPIVGLNYKDEDADARHWLSEWGNPYFVNAIDNQGDVAIDWGVYGVPETFVIDADGIVRYKHIGPLTSEQAEREIVARWHQSKSKS